MTVAAELIDVAKEYRSSGEVVRALDHVSLEFKTGRLTSLRGPSGSGKSTLLNILAGLSATTHGEVRVMNIVLGSLGPFQLQRLRRNFVGIMFPELPLVSHLTALENVALPLIFDGSPRQECLSKSKEILKRLQLLSRLTHKPYELSTGERQRVAFARAIIRNPPLLLADEPTANLDSPNVDHLMQLLQDVCSEGKTVVVASHDDRVHRNADKTYCLVDGKVVTDDQP